MAAALVPLQNITLSGSQSSITFGSIPTTGYRDLRIVFSAIASGGADVRMSFNGDNSDGNYARVTAAGSGSATSSVTSSPRSINYWGSATSGSEYNVITVDIMDAFATDKHKTSLTRAGRAGAGVEMITSRWASTSAITTILLDNANSQTFSAGSKVALYGVIS